MCGLGLRYEVMGESGERDAKESGLSRKVNEKDV